MQWGDQIDVPPSFHHLLNYSTFHWGYVAKTEGVDDLERGRVRICIPAMGEGEENWTNPTHVLSNNISSTKLEGDHGLHTPPQVGQQVLVFFKDGDPLQPFAIPGPPWSEEPEAGKQMFPKEVKEAANQDKQHLVHMWKTPAGHTLYMGDETNKEAAYFMHAGGFGIFMDGGIKGTEPTQNEKQATKPRTAERRKDKSVATKTQKGPGELYKDGKATLRILGQNGSGITMVDAADGSGMIIRVADSKNSENGPSIFMSSKDGGSIILTAGAAQIQIRGKTGDVKFNKNIIQELIKYEVEIESVRPQMDTLSEVSKNALYTGGTADQG